MKNTRLLRCIGQIDDDLILEAEYTRLRNRRKSLLPALAACLTLAACLGLIIAAPHYLSAPQNTDTLLADKMQPASESPETAEFSFGGLALNMTKKQVLELLGEPDQIAEEDRPRWFYPSVTIQFHPFDQKVCKIWLLKGCELTLSNGIGIGSTEETIQNTYPHDPMMQDYPKTPYLQDAFLGDIEGYTDNTQDALYQINTENFAMQLGVHNGSVEFIYMLRFGDPMLDALTVDSITIYSSADGLRPWEGVTVIDKAAKGICTVLTISEPEDPWSEKVGPFYWLDFGNGTAAELYGNDHAAIFTYSGETFDPSRTDGLVWHLSGCFYGLDDYVARALENPTETWESES